MYTRCPTCDYRSIGGVDLEVKGAVEGKIIHLEIGHHDLELTYKTSREIKELLDKLLPKLLESTR